MRKTGEINALGFLSVFNRSFPDKGSGRANK